MKGSITGILIVVIGVIAILGMVGYVFFIKPQQVQVTSTDNSTAATSTIPEKDFAPGIPMSQKTSILIQSSDSTEEKYIVPTNQEDMYVKQLPAGYHVVSKSP